MADDRRQSLQGSSSCRRRQRRKSGQEPYQRGLNTQLHLAVEALGLPVSVIVTEGTTADGTQALKLIKGIAADHLIADQGYDTDAILEQAARKA